MSTKKGLLTVAAMALAMMGIAPSATAATDGVVRDVTTSGEIPAGTELHFVGWMTLYQDAEGNRLTCDATTMINASSGTTATVATIKILPDTTSCTRSGLFAFCQLQGHQATDLPYDVTATAADFVITSSSIHLKFGGILCPWKELTASFSEITLTPVKTGAREVTGTSGHLGKTAAAGDPIAGFEISGALSGSGISTSGEFELTEPDRCTWELSVF